jgi:hypothetical protein
MVRKLSFVAMWALRAGVIVPSREGESLRRQVIVGSPAVPPRLGMSSLWIWHRSLPFSKNLKLIAEALLRFLPWFHPGNATVGRDSLGSSPPSSRPGLLFLKRSEWRPGLR